VATMKIAPRSTESELKSKTESLGTKIIQGVAAEGKRHTMTIPAGAEGNDQPMQIVDEQWYSSELQTMIMDAPQRSAER